MSINFDKLQNVTKLHLFQADIMKWSYAALGIRFPLTTSIRPYSADVLPGREARCSSVVRAFAHGTMGRRIDPSWGGPIELFLDPASAPRLV